jgi:uncharacterized membrane protein YccF (DUF307 family)
MYGQPPVQSPQWYPQSPPMGQQPYNQPLMQQPQQYLQQPPVIMQNYYQPPIQPMMTVNVNVGATGPSFLIRVLWFIFIGWWLGFWWLSVGYLLCVSIVLFPVGLMLLNRLPQVLTLRATSQQTQVTVSHNAVTVTVGTAQQRSMLLRALYFAFVGWWLGGVWCYVGYSLCLTIVLLPAGLLMLNRLPLVLTLRQN